MTWHRHFSKDIPVSQQLQDFSFFSTWYGILQQINVVSKCVLSQNFDWWNSKELTTGFHEFLRKYKKVCPENSFNNFGTWWRSCSRTWFSNYKMIARLEMSFSLRRPWWAKQDAREEIRNSLFCILLDIAFMSNTETSGQMSKQRKTGFYE